MSTQRGDAHAGPVRRAVSSCFGLRIECGGGTPIYRGVFLALTASTRNHFQLPQPLLHRRRSTDNEAGVITQRVSCLDV
eukprot:4291223-Prymnesium_polylepis.1